MPRVRRGWHADPYVSPFVQHAVAKAQARTKTTRKPKPQREWNDNFTHEDLFDPKLKKREIFKPVPGKYMADETPLDIASDDIPSSPRKTMTTRTNKATPMNNPYKRIQASVQEVIQATSPSQTFTPQPIPFQKEENAESVPMTPRPSLPSSPVVDNPPVLSSGWQQTRPSIIREQPASSGGSLRRVVTRSTSPIDDRTLHFILRGASPQHPAEAPPPPPKVQVPHSPSPAPTQKAEVDTYTPVTHQSDAMFSKMLDMQLRTQELNNQANEAYMANMMRMLERMLPSPPPQVPASHTSHSSCNNKIHSSYSNATTKRRKQRNSSSKSAMMNIVLQKLQDIESVEEDLMRQLNDSGKSTTERKGKLVAHSTPRQTQLNNAMSIPSEIRHAKPVSATPTKLVRRDDASPASPAYDISRAPRIADTHEISPLYQDALDRRSVVHRKLFKENDKHFAEEQQCYYRSLALAQSDPVQQQECDKYRKDFKNARRMRELSYREHGTSVCELGNRLTERLLDDLLDELTDELDGAFDDYASKCIEKL